MPDPWTGDVVGRCHVAGITLRQLASRCGITAAYLSTVLAGQKGNAGTREKIMAALSEMEAEASAKESSNGTDD